MKVTTLIEDTRIKKELHKELGLSLLIETRQHRILLDTGQSGCFADNAETLGIDLSLVDACVISHAHFDHGGGLQRFFNANSFAPVYIHRNAQNQYVKLPDSFASASRVPVQTVSPLPKSIGIDPSLLLEYANRIRYINCSQEIFSNIFLLTDIPQHHMTPPANKHLFTVNQDLYVKDDFKHETGLAVIEDHGITLFSGCCHNGILNMMDAVKGFFGEDFALRAIIGGFHLALQPGKSPKTACTPAELEQLADAFIEKRIHTIHTGHCTGQQAFDALKHLLGSRLHRLETGKSFVV